jgi:hypothetical protein
VVRSLRDLKFGKGNKLKMAQKKKKEANYLLILVVLLVIVIGISLIQNGRRDIMTSFPIPDMNKMVTTDTGLQYQDFEVGTGEEAGPGDTVSVHYTGWLMDETKFDSSLDRNEAFEFQLGAARVIRGWDEGVQGMQVGGKRLLVIPSNLGYGTQGAGGGLIPPNATLVFMVELLEIK